LGRNRLSVLSRGKAMGTQGRNNRFPVSTLMRMIIISVSVGIFLAMICNPVCGEEMWLETEGESSYVGMERMIEVKFGEFPVPKNAEDNISNTLLWSKTGSSIYELKLKKEGHAYIVKMAPKSAGYYTVAAYTDFGIKGGFLTCFCSKIEVPFYGKGGEVKYEPKIFDKDRIPLEILITTESSHNRRYTGDELTVRVLYKGRPLSDAEISLVTDSGWTKRIKTDADGEGKVTLLTDRAVLLKEHGATKRYMFRVDYTDKAAGVDKGKGYQGNRYISTLVIGVYSSPHTWESSKMGYLTVLATALIVGLGISLRRHLRRRNKRLISGSD